MTSITMESRCLDNLLPPGAQRQREADYLCLTATSAIMYHGDGHTHPNYMEERNNFVKADASSGSRVNHCCQQP